MTNPPRARITVMIVDDHPLVRSAVARAVNADDMEIVAEASSAEEALEIAPLFNPDVMLVDIALPGISGLQLVRELAPRLPRTRILMLSMSSADRDVADAMRNGAKGYLTKDVSPDALARSIRGAMSGELIMPRKLAARLLAQMTWRGAREPIPEHDAGEPLTRREIDVLRLVADVLSDRDVAVALTISSRTVETHVGSILRKLGVRNRGEAAQRYRDEY
jgi:DNA-binding NarL/FixJ family response regulator